MPTLDIQSTEANHQWPGYVMVCGLLCVLAGILFPSVVRPGSLLGEIMAIVGYFGLLLVFIGFFIHISIED